ncbi:MAG: hypothetical protein Q4C03_04805, partial [bacterium]|nr:hypothetical protein [bacterium]
MRMIVVGIQGEGVFYVVLNFCGFIFLLFAMNELKGVVLFWKIWRGVIFLWTRGGVLRYNSRIKAYINMLTHLWI